MPKYVDGFVIPVPKKNLAAYKKMATEAGKIWKKYGALDYKECVSDDLKPQGMETAMFPTMTKLKPTEVLLFSYIVYKSRAHRDSVNAKVMKDPFMKKYENKPMPFDMKRFAFGGFTVLVDPFAKK